MRLSLLNISNKNNKGHGGIEIKAEKVKEIKVQV
jgi:hypothetical protein